MPRRAIGLLQACFRDVHSCPQAQGYSVNACLCLHRAVRLHAACMIAVHKGVEYVKDESRLQVEEREANMNVEEDTRNVSSVPTANDAGRCLTACIYT